MFAMEHKQQWVWSAWTMKICLSEKPNSGEGDIQMIKPDPAARKTPPTTICITSNTNYWTFFFSWQALEMPEEVYSFVHTSCFTGNIFCHSEFIPRALILPENTITVIWRKFIYLFIHLKWEFTLFKDSVDKSYKWYTAIMIIIFFFKKKKQQ